MKISDLYIPVQFEKNVTPEEMLKAVNHQKEKGYLSPATFGNDTRDVAIPKMKIADDVCDEIIAYATHMKKMDFLNKSYVVESKKNRLPIPSLFGGSKKYANSQKIC